MRLACSVVAGALLISGCSTNEVRSTETVTLRMEMAYNYFGNATGTHRVWAIERVPLGLVAGFEPEDALSATLACHQDACSVVGVEKPRGAPSPMALSGKLHGAISGEPDALLILQPFPMEPSPALFKELDYQEGVTKLVDVRYQRVNSQLVFQDMRAAGTQKREPIVWK
jgi:hypothetical protein